MITGIEEALIQLGSIPKICNRLLTNKLSLDMLEAEYMIIGIEQALIQLGSIPKILRYVIGY